MGELGEWDEWVEVGELCDTFIQFTQFKKSPNSKLDIPFADPIMPQKILRRRAIDANFFTRNGMD